MFETAGTLTIVELASSLVALVLLPLLWAAVAAVVALRRAGAAHASRTVVVTSAGTLALAAVHAFLAAQLPAGHVASQHVAAVARIGQLDLSLDLARDPTSAAFATLVASLAFVAVLHAVWTEGVGLAGRLAWIGLATSATMLVVLADGFVAVALGLQLATLAGWALAGGRAGRSLGLALAGDTALMFAVWILFWGLGGTFGVSGYTPDPRPRFALVVLPDAPRADGKATVSLKTYEGATVSSDEGPPLPGEPLRAPFTVSLEPGNYSFQIDAGAATSELLVTHVTLAAGRAYVLTPYGPTTSFRNLVDQLAVPRPAPAGPTSVRSTLASRSIGGVRISTVLGMGVVLAVLLRLALLARKERRDFAFVLEAIPPVAVVLHLAPLVEPGAAVAIAIAPALAAVALAADAASSRSRPHGLRAALAALTAMAVASVLLGETAAAVTIVMAASAGTAAASVAVESEGDVRWLGVACAGLAGILPGAGVSPGLAAAVTGAFGASAANRWAGGVVAPLLTIAVILCALAQFRVYSAGVRRRGSPVGPHGPRVLVIGLAAASTLGGAALGVGTSPFGGQAVPLARRLVPPGGGLDGVPRMAVAGLVLAIAAASIGLAAARKASRTPALPSWITALAAPALVVERAAGAAVELLRFFVRSVVIMNEDVIDDATEVVASGFSVLGRVVRRADRAVAEGTVGHAIARGANELVVRTKVDDPRGLERVRLGLLIGMVAILGLVVLSSVVGG
jgi:hypothetical protein